MANTIRIYRSKQAEELDELFSGTPEQLRAVYTVALQRYSDYDDQPLADLVADLADQAGIPWVSGTADHFRDAEWSSGRDVIIKYGYCAAFQLALEHDPPVPLETFWVTGAGDDFEVHISDGEHRVTVFMLVPPGPKVPAGSLRAKAKSWVVTAGDRAEDPGRASVSLDGAEVVKLEVSGAPDNAS